MSFSVFLVTFFTWIVLTNSIKTEELITGLIVAVVISIVFKRYYKIRFDAKLIPRIFLFVFAYLPVFIWEMIKANIDVAKRVLNPKLPLNPGFVRIKTDLKGEVSRLSLANSITLTPGTLTLDVRDQELCIHWIDVKATDPEGKRKYISGRFEKLIKGVFE